jgi:hypothetical protein
LKRGVFAPEKGSIRPVKTGCIRPSTIAKKVKIHQKLKNDKKTSKNNRNRLHKKTLIFFIKSYEAKYMWKTQFKTAINNHTLIILKTTFPFCFGVLLRSMLICTKTQIHNRKQRVLLPKNIHGFFKWQIFHKTQDETVPKNVHNNSHKQVHTLHKKCSEKFRKVQKSSEKFRK